MQTLSTPPLTSKLPQVGTTIFAVMSALAQKHQAVNLSQGFPDFPIDSRLIDLVEKNMRQGFNQYAPMAGWMPLRERIAEKTALCYGYSPDPETEITLTSGATEALFDIIAATVHPGDEVIVLEPGYDSYVPAILLAGGVPVPVNLDADKGYSIPTEALRAAISPRTKLLIFNTPHNPTGTIWRKEEMETLAELVRDTDILLLSDEVYEHLIFDQEQHQSVLRFPELRARSFVVSSFGKSFHATGWKLGYCIAPPALTAEMRKVHQYVTFSSPTPMQCAIAEYLEQPEHYLNLGVFYQQKRDYMQQLLAQTPFEILPCGGTYFQLLGYGHLSDEPDTTYAERLTREVGVATIPVSVFYSDKTDRKVIRLCFAKRPETLEAAVARFVTHQNALSR
jgi:methionine aminotransferase